MNMKHSIRILFFAFLLLSCVKEEDIAVAPAGQDAAVDESASCVSGVARVLFSEDMAEMIEGTLASGTMVTKSAAFNGTIDGLGVTDMYRLFPHAGEYEERTRREGLHRWYVVKYSEDVPHTKAAGSLELLDGVHAVEPVRKIKSTAVFNDPYFSRLWGLSSAFDINVEPVWELYTTGNPDVVVAIVDSGVDLDHEDLAANVLASGHHDFVSNAPRVSAGDHGTHVAGTIAAVSNNGKGVSGIAGGDFAAGQGGVKLLSCQIFDIKGDSSPDASANAIKTAADKGAVISQNSWGYTYDLNNDGKLDADEKKIALAAKVNESDKAAIDYFIKYAGCDNYGNQLPNSPMKGGVVIFAAGNDAIEAGAPANYEPVVAVGAIANSGIRSTFSNYGSWVDIAAPGTDIFSTVPDDKYVSMDGTSMACPHVSGVAALIVSQFGGPGFTNEMLEEKLIGGANHTILPSSYKIGPLLDAYGSFTYGSTAVPEPVTDLQVSARANGADLEFTVTSDDEGQPAYGFLVLYSTDRKKVESATPKDRNGVESHMFTLGLGVNEEASYLLKGLEFEQEYYLKMCAYSYNLNYSEPTEIMSLVTGKNNAPVISCSATNIRLKAHETITIPVSIIEPDGHDLLYVTDDGVEQTPVDLYVRGSKADAFKKSGDDYVITITGRNAPTGKYSAGVTAKDEYGMWTRKYISYEILENTKPEILKEIDDIYIEGKDDETVLDMSQYLYDADGETLTYSMEYSDSRVAYVFNNSGRLYVTPLNYGETFVTVTAHDVRDEKCILEFKIVVKDTSDPVSVYPNPVKDYLNVSTMKPARTRVEIRNGSGKSVYDKTSEISAVDPLKVDMRSMAPGAYSVKVSFDGKEYVRNIVKL